MTHRTIILAAVFVAFAVVFAAAPARADNPHFVKGPDCTVSLSSGLTCSGTVAGLGTAPDSVHLTATSVSGTWECVNKGGNVAPGQPTQSGGVAGPPGTITSSGGNISFTASLGLPSAPSPSGCPNGNWKLRLTSVTYSGVSVVFEKPSGTIEATLSIGNFTAP